ncbi:MAG TPA: TonB-dependent receptor [Blastocatellia bacterium]|nr:TonB-dependent receptor [Blastocatellia bacterium]
MKIVLSACALAALLMMGAARVSAQAPGPAPDLTTASLEELMNIEVTSASKKEERLFQTAAAISVITQEEIRRSGMTSLPELLRLVPGLHVARIDGNKWAITARGFNSRFPNKLLVLIDGRSIYTPQFSGVYWEAQFLPLEEIERIEVIRGPGGALWGANAVNGVINIITKSAAETQGGLMSAGGGSEDHAFGSLRYGGTAGANAHYRIHARSFSRSGLLDASGREAPDGQRAVSGGFRLDWSRSGRDALTLQGDIYDSTLRETSTPVTLPAPFAPPRPTPGEFTGGNVMGHWNHIFSERSDATLQIYFDRSRREIRDVGERVDTIDFDFQHHLALKRRQDLIWGVGYRLIADQTNGNLGTPAQFTPKGRSFQIFSAFVQDELMLIKNRLRLTLGTKLEHNDYTGYEVQPSARLLWTPSARQTVWAAASRAVRTPARTQNSLRINATAFPGPDGLIVFSTLIGSPDPQSEELRAYELGYRAQPSRKLSLDLAAFYNVYDRLVTFDPGPPFFDTFGYPHLTIPLRFGNLMNGRVYGAELSATADLTRRWRVRGGYSFLAAELNHKLAGQDQNVDLGENHSPKHQFQVHSYFKLPGRLELDNGLYYLTKLSAQSIPGYTRLDLRLGWKMRESFELSFGAQNLLDDRHPEFNSLDSIVITSQAKRSFYGKATWRF